jgi:hypothetical protein
VIIGSRVVLFDQKDAKGGEREFTVETDANAYAAYYDNAFAWLLAKQDWKVDDTVLVPSTRVATSDAEGVTLVDTAGKAMGKIGYAGPVLIKMPKPVANTDIDAFISKSGTQALLKDYRVVK